MTETLRIVFAGTPEFAVPGLRSLLRGPHTVCAVYTQPDRPAGRGRRLHPSPVKQTALEHAIPVYQPESLKPAEAQAELAALCPDLMVVAAYGLILPQAVLDTPRLGCLNIHASLLPRWRGAAPIQRALLAGDDLTGITIMQMDAGLDTGAMLLKQTCPIHPDDTGQSLHDRLALLGAEVLGEALAQLKTLTPRPQDPARATYAHKLSKTEAELDWSRPALELERQVRAFNAWPVAQTTLHGLGLRVWRAQALDEAHEATPGHIVRAAKSGLDVACGEGVLRLLEVQKAGGRRVSVADLLNAYPAWVRS